MTRPTIAANIEEIVSEPRFFLHGIDIEQGQLVYLESSRELLSRAAFVDGRSVLGINDQRIHLPLKQVLDWHHSQNQTCDRLIAHTAFCGSTLLARALDYQNQSFVYKEPQALIDLVTIKQSGHRMPTTDLPWQALVKFTLGQFRKRWSDNEVSVVKPSNWVNILLPELLRQTTDFKLVLLSSSLRDFLLAILRGGRDRFAYVLNFLNQIRLEYPQYGATLATIENESEAGLPRVLKYCALAYHLQREVFERIKADNKRPGGRPVLNVTMEQLLAQPEQTVRRVADHLDVPLSEDALNGVQSRVFGRHSKETQMAFGADQVAAQNQDVEQQYTGELNQVIDWYNSRFMPNH